MLLQRYDLARMDHTRTSQDGDFLGLLALPPGRYEFKFVIDGVWQTNEAWPVAKDKRGILNNILEVNFFLHFSSYFFFGECFSFSLAQLGMNSF